MTFRHRNAFYLRIAAHIVLQLYVYIDEEHIPWMTDAILQEVLADLRPHIRDKLRVEQELASSRGANSKKTSGLELYRGVSYQCGYFFRKSQSHGLLIKRRQYVTAPSMPSTLPPARKPEEAKGKSRRRPPKKAPRPRKRKVPEDEDSDEIEMVSGADTDPEASGSGAPAVATRRSARSKPATTRSYAEDVDEVAQDPATTDNNEQPASSPKIKDEETDDVIHLGDSLDRMSQTPIPPFDDTPINVDEDEPKPILQLEYNSFSIYGHCLCIIVQPNSPSDPPHEPGVLRAPSLARQTGEPSSPAGSPRPGTSASAATPLFREATPLSDDGNADENENHQFIAFSQMLSSIRHAGRFEGMAEAEDEDDGAVFMGDADEG